MLYFFEDTFHAMETFLSYDIREQPEHDKENMAPNKPQVYRSTDIRHKPPVIPKTFPLKTELPGSPARSHHSDAKPNNKKQKNKRNNSKNKNKENKENFQNKNGQNHLAINNNIPIGLGAKVTKFVENLSLSQSNTSQDPLNASLPVSVVSTPVPVITEPRYLILKIFETNNDPRNQPPRYNNNNNFRPIPLRKILTCWKIVPGQKVDLFLDPTQ